MKCAFEYLATTTYLDTFEVENIGECCLEAYNDSGEAYFLCISTSLGVSKILEYGPYMDGLVPVYLTYKYQEFTYNEKKLKVIINKFLNDMAKNITQVREVNYDDIKGYFISPKEFMDGGDKD